MRAYLFKEESGFSRQFLKVILEIYSEVVAPWWAVRQKPLICNEIMAKEVRLVSKKDTEVKLKEHTEWEKKQTASTEKII